MPALLHLQFDAEAEHSPGFERRAGSQEPCLHGMLFLRAYMRYKQEQQN